ncbi:antA/AntB antirepressor family protein [Corynebacterium sp. p3-SID1194]|uniref:antA/AntB antirepressor family protein n=1 Tax=Corynebacterium sp. p3-SID1194 TaxID=2916105 RepID=UPI0021A6A547|nr:antA/AntB antirepressor family protein [Corynebacterium sp. p3-SID1194]MCT1450615.1 antA/AntB antirepressor family protein [Corynebacterium sp. p3-SID1194]
MNELIPLTEREGVQAVMGRDLHTFLEVRTPYDKWMPRMLEYGFVAGQDFSTKMSETSHLGGRPRTDHIVTLDMAKEIAMIQRTDRGKQARQYFIEVEKRARQVEELTPEQLMAKALLQAESTMKDLEVRAVTAEASLEAAAPALEYHEKFVAEDDDLTTIDDFARVYGTTGPKVRALMTEKNVAFRQKVGARWSRSKGCMVDEHEWRARADRASYGWFKLGPQHNAPRLHNGQVRQTLYVKTFHMHDLAKRLGIDHFGDALIGYGGPVDE